MSRLAPFLGYCEQYSKHECGSFSVVCWLRVLWEDSQVVYKEIVVDIHNGASYSCKEKWSHCVCKKMNGTDDHYGKQSNPDLEKQISCVFFYMWNLDLKLCVCVCARERRLGEGVRYPWTGITSDCELLDVGAGSWIQAFGRSRKILTTEPSLQLFFFFFDRLTHVDNELGLISFSCWNHLPDRFPSALLLPVWLSVFK